MFHNNGESLLLLKFLGLVFACHMLYSNLGVFISPAYTVFASYRNPFKITKFPPGSVITMEAGIKNRHILKLIALVALYYLLFSGVALFFYTATLIPLVLVLILVPLLLIGYRRYSRNPASTTPICSIPTWDSDMLTEIPQEEPVAREPVGEGEPAPREDI